MLAGGLQQAAARRRVWRGCSAALFQLHRLRSHVATSSPLIATSPPPHRASCGGGGRVPFVLRRCSAPRRRTAAFARRHSTAASSCGGRVVCRRPSVHRRRQRARRAGAHTTRGAVHEGVRERTRRSEIDRDRSAASGYLEELSKREGRATADSTGALLTPIPRRAPRRGGAGGSKREHASALRANEREGVGAPLSRPAGVSGGVCWGSLLARHGTNRRRQRRRRRRPRASH